MLEKLKANILFHLGLKRPKIEKAYAMVGPEDSWYDTITTVHKSLATIQQLPRQDWEIKSHDGLTLKAVFYPGSSDKTLIWVHGYTSHAERESAFPGLFYHSLGYNVLIPYLRAHGPSEGKYISLGAMESLDMARWVSKVNDLHPEGQILIHGLSMGGGVVLDLTTVEMANVKCLIADAPVRDIEGFFRTISNQVFKKSADKVSRWAIKRFQDEFGVDAAAYDRVKNINKGRYPLLLSAGSNEKCEELFEQIKKNNPAETRVVILPGCSHGNGMYKQTAMYQGVIRAFLDDYMK